jgi:hypothetical protein
MSAETGLLYYRTAGGYSSAPAILVAENGADRLVAVYAWPVFAQGADPSALAGTPVPLGSIALVASRPLVVSVPESATPPTLLSDPDAVYVPN